MYEIGDIVHVSGYEVCPIGHDWVRVTVVGMILDKEIKNGSLIYQTIRMDGTISCIYAKDIAPIEQNTNENKF